jgi:hypothetical protein
MTGPEGQRVQRLSHHSGRETCQAEHHGDFASSFGHRAQSAQRDLSTPSAMKIAHFQARQEAERGVVKKDAGRR